MKKISLIFLIVVALFAGNPNKVGTAAGLVLSLSSDPRGLALNGAHYGSVDGLSAIFFNPAGLAKSTDLSFNVSQMSYLAEMKLSQLAFGFKPSESSILAISARFFSVGDIKVTTLEQESGTGEIVNPSMSVIGFSYAYQFTQSISFGTTLNVLSENFIKVQGSAFAVDLGIQYKSSEGLAFGIALKNVGSDVNYNGTGAKALGDAGQDNSPFYIEYESPALPTQFIMSLNYLSNFDSDNSLNIMGTFTNNNQGLDRFTTGLEYSFENMFFLRGSYQATGEKNAAPSLFTGTGLGFGLKLELDEISNVNFDYSVKSVNVDGFDAINSFGVNLNF